jgi:lysozyme
MRARLIAAALTLSAAGLAGIVTHEREVRAVYLDPVGIPTACVGHTATVTHADVGKTLSGEVCRQLLERDTRASVKTVQHGVKVPITQEQFDALVSFEFNVGRKALLTSTLLRKLNAGDCWGAAREFDRWIRAKGRVLRGLIKRRADERRLFETGCSP